MPAFAPFASQRPVPVPAAATRPLPPGPRGHWLWGHLREYRQNRLPFLESLRDQYGPMVRYRLGRHPFVLISEPAVIEQVLVARNKDFRKFYITRMLSDLFGQGLLTSEGDHWLRQRRLIQPVFAREQIAASGASMVRNTLAMAAGWAFGEPRDMCGEMQRLTMAIAAETLLGVRVSGELWRIREPHDLLRADFDRRVESLWTLPRWAPTPRNLRVRGAQRAIESLVDDLISRRRQQGAGSEGTDILSRLISMRDEQGEPMPDRQIRHEALTFLFAGHETTASTLAFCWLMIAQHPQVEARLHAELDQVLNGREPTAADVQRLPYTESVFRETLRLYPSSYGIGRTANQDCELGGYHIPQGTNVILSQWLTQRDPRFYERPLAFEPERWTPEFQQRLPHFAWFPFGGGPRVCIGNMFAMLEGVLVLAAVASRYRLRLLPGQTIVPHASVTLRASPAIEMVCEPRSLQPLGKHSFAAEFLPQPAQPRPQDAGVDPQL